MKWIVETLNQAVDEELDALDATFKAKFLHIAEMLQEFGPENVKQPHTKFLGDKLWEIRMKGKTGIARAIYAITKDRRIIVLHAFVKKSQKTPQKAMKMAKKRLAEVK